MKDEWVPGVDGVMNPQRFCFAFRARFALKQKQTHSEAVVEESVNDRINEAVGHRQPMDDVEHADEEVLLRRRLVVDQFRMEVDNCDEGVQRQPADGKQRHNDDQHLDYLRT